MRCMTRRVPVTALHAGYVIMAVTALHALHAGLSACHSITRVPVTALHALDAGFRVVESVEVW